MDRRKRIEEKRRRLAELRRRKAEKAKQKREKVPKKKEKKVDVTESNTTTNLDNLIEGLLATSTPGEVSEKKPETVVTTSSSESTTTTTQSEKENVPVKVEKKEDVLASLTISGPMGSVSLVSYAKETYDKSCQTMPPRRDSTLSTTSSTNITPDVPVTTTPSVEEDEEDQSTEEETEEDTKTTRINDATFTSFLNRASTVMERAIQCNEDFDITVEYGLVSDTTESSKEKESFLDLSFNFQSSRWSSSRTVTDVNWSNHYKELVLATYNARSSPPETLEQLCDPDGVLLVWSTKRASKPEFVFTCQSALMTARFHDFSPNLIAGATYSGQVVVWDIRTKSEPVQRSPISSEGHTHPIRALSVVGSTNSHSIVTVSSDGKLCKWDTSQLLKPAESMQISYHKRGGTGIKEDVVIMSMARTEASPETVYMGSENGHIYKSFTDERNMSKDAVKRYPPESEENVSLGSASSIRDADISRRRRHHNRRRVDGHFGPVTAMDFHPGTFGLSRFYDSSELMLSSSVDWTCKLWDLKKSPLPLCEFQCTNDYVLDVQWSPKHPAVFAASDGEGSLQLWNLNKSTDTPVFRTQGKSALNCVRWSTNGEHIAAGSSDGTLDVYKVSGLDPSQDEASEFAKTLARISELNSVSGDVF